MSEGEKDDETRHTTIPSYLVIYLTRLNYILNPKCNHSKDVCFITYVDGKLTNGTQKIGIDAYFLLEEVVK